MASIDQTVAFLYSFWQMKLPTTFRARRAGESLLRRQSRRFLANATTLPRAPEEESAGCQNPAQGRPKIFSYRDFMPSRVELVFPLSHLYY